MLLTSAAPFAAPPEKVCTVNLAAVVGNEVVCRNRQADSLDNWRDVEVEPGVCSAVVITAVESLLGGHVRVRLLEQIKDIAVVQLVPGSGRRVRRKTVARVDVVASGGVEGVVAGPPVKTCGSIGHETGHQRIVLVCGGDVRVWDVQVQHDEHVLLSIVVHGAVVD